MYLKNLLNVNFKAIDIIRILEKECTVDQLVNVCLELDSLAAKDRSKSEVTNSVSEEVLGLKVDTFKRATFTGEDFLSVVFSDYSEANMESFADIVMGLQSLLEKRKQILNGSDADFRRNTGMGISGGGG